MSCKVPQDGAMDGPRGVLSLQQPGGQFYHFYPRQCSSHRHWAPCLGFGAKAGRLSVSWGSLLPTLQLSLGAGRYFAPSQSTQSNPTSQAARGGPGQPCHPSFLHEVMLMLHQADAAQCLFGGWMKPHSYCTRWYLQQLRLVPCFGYVFHRDEG